MSPRKHWPSSLTDDSITNGGATETTTRNMVFALPASPKMHRPFRLVLGATATASAGATARRPRTTVPSRWSTTSFAAPGGRRIVPLDLGPGGGKQSHGRTNKMAIDLHLDRSQREQPHREVLIVMIQHVAGRVVRFQVLAATLQLHLRPFRVLKLHPTLDEIGQVRLVPQVERVVKVRLELAATAQAHVQRLLLLRIVGRLARIVELGRGRRVHPQPDEVSVQHLHALRFGHDQPRYLQVAQDQHHALGGSTGTFIAFPASANDLAAGLSPTITIPDSGMPSIESHVVVISLDEKRPLSGRLM
uniref:Uncharacterized protein n=1 Tax=Anopheles merus TaxID=30066 RepID=A0A182V5R6_ANOME